MTIPLGKYFVVNLIMLSLPWREAKGCVEGHLSDIVSICVLNNIKSFTYLINWTPPFPPLTSTVPTYRSTWLLDKASWFNLAKWSSYSGNLLINSWAVGTARNSSGTIFSTGRVERSKSSPANRPQMTTFFFGVRVKDYKMYSGNNLPYDPRPYRLNHLLGQVRCIRAPWQHWQSQRMTLG